MTGAAQGVQSRTTSRDEQAAAVLRTLELEAMLFGRQLEPALRHTSDHDRLDRSAYALLTRLQVQGPMSIGELSDAFSLDVSTVNRQAGAVLHAGLVERIPDPDGGMARKFRLTTEGRRRLDDERESNLRGLALVVGSWTTEDVDALATLMRRLNLEIEDRRGRRWPRP
ncbi:MarR family winged helix-turn-helix transcriptional regulator [Cellulomonas soli]|uniref:Transcriptional regulator n=1 Tax=Cellulomonas soli TaxID=931535 RepID=A0A512PD66_9CELL|nr:MarR family transcriptional regulator [Cellulomonas soli]NYI60194.1 DNA-binding MarR family transcriptional regulator [Cellulomonas soli]GEP69153.1 transcriptional regulator [Cellulomonas soli]